MDYSAFDEDALKDRKLGHLDNSTGRRRSDRSDALRGLGLSGSSWAGDSQQILDPASPSAPCPVKKNSETWNTAPSSCCRARSLGPHFSGLDLGLLTWNLGLQWGKSSQSALLLVWGPHLPVNSGRQWSPLVPLANASYRLLYGLRGAAAHQEGGLLAARSLGQREYSQTHLTAAARWVEAHRSRSLGLGTGNWAGNQERTL